MSDELETTTAERQLPLVLVVDDDTRNAKLVACSLATVATTTVSP